METEIFIGLLDLHTDIYCSKQVFYDDRYQFNKSL